MCPLCSILETGTHILFSCSAARALWSFIREALGSDWEAGDLAEFLQGRATQPGHKRRLFWCIFVALMWTLWTTLNKMVIEQIFPRRTSDSFFKFLTFLQYWHLLARHRVRDLLGVMLDVLVAAAQHLCAPWACFGVCH
uniref:Reverse transcriptase zinc-binding domain-containing protein n=1 Tax=Triticum urartu TaxID=4572 RepID=A0A8R7K1N1_TRIUA